jgi:hypothetical protein
LTQCTSTRRRGRRTRAVTSRKGGAKLSLPRDGLDELRRYLQGFWSDALAAYSAEIDRQVKAD